MKPSPWPTMNRTSGNTRPPIPGRRPSRKAPQFVEFLKRACLHAAPLINPKDVAWFLASYARDALFRVEQQRDLPALQTVRSALEDALGMKFTDEKGEHFFRSTLVQTLFYGVFSAWVRWHKDNPAPKQSLIGARRNGPCTFPSSAPCTRKWPSRAAWDRLGWWKCWIGRPACLNRVDRDEFFASFEDEHAVQYFYEPFLEAYDPELRKALGVWYTPPEIVKYQVARVDTVLREELDLPDGLADPQRHRAGPLLRHGGVPGRSACTALPPRCRDKGGDALVASDLKQAAMNRVFGFEIMPAPFVVSHLQLGLMLQSQGAPLSQRRASASACI